MLIIVIIFALLGMQLFGGLYTEAAGYGDCDGCDDVPRYNFDYFGPAMLTIFIIMTGAWYDPMNDAMPVTGSWCSYFFVAVVVVGMYMIMNLFVAVLLESFAVSAAPLPRSLVPPRPPRPPRLRHARDPFSHYPRKKKRRHRRHRCATAAAARPHTRRPPRVAGGR